ncbi:MAG: BCD family MFS transporter, partial [Tabrizicola sp.]|nr:BCD family MFS transporter [Tabrizicola sp.]
LALGAWGAVQTTAAGTAIAVGGVIRDLLATGTGPAAAPYIPVFAIEGMLLLAALLVALPLRRAGLDQRRTQAISTAEVPMRH